MHTVVDTFSSYAFGFLHISKQPQAAVAVLHNDVPPFYRRQEISVSAVPTENEHEFCVADRHPYALYLELNHTEDRCTHGRSLQTNGFVDRFPRKALNEFHRIAFRRRIYPTLADLQEDLNDWLTRYNHHRPHLGYRNQGRPPSKRSNNTSKKANIDMIQEKLKNTLSSSDMPFYEDLGLPWTGFTKTGSPGLRRTFWASSPGVRGNHVHNGQKFC